MSTFLELGRNRLDVIIHFFLTGKIEGWGVSVRDRETMNHEKKGFIVTTDVPEEDPVLFREEDAWAWVFFTFVFLFLVLFDNLVLWRRNVVLTFRVASQYSISWILCAVCFNVFVYVHRNLNDAFDWTTGYVLEWMLSVDNLFVFHLVFQIYGCPDKLKHKPLFWGVMGAVFFRMIFFCVGEVLLHTMHFMHLIFGAFLIYTGVRTALVDDEEEDPSKNPVVVWMSRQLPVLNGYDDKGSFFVKVQLDSRGDPVLPPESPLMQESTPRGNSPIIPIYQSTWYTTPREEDEIKKLSEQLEEEELEEGEKDEGKRKTKRPSSIKELPPPYEWRCTLLFVTVVCLEITDVVFAVDSVTAIIGQIQDLYLAYTACIFAMLGLRATFFVVDELIRLFSLLKYGVAFILVFIGLKLIVRKIIHIPPWFVCIILVSTLFISISGSLVLESMQRRADEEYREKAQKSESDEKTALVVKNSAQAAG